MLLTAEPTDDKPHASAQHRCLELPEQFAIAPGRVVDPDANSHAADQNSDHSGFGDPIILLGAWFGVWGRLGLKHRHEIPALLINGFVCPHKSWRIV